MTESFPTTAGRRPADFGGPSTSSAAHNHSHRHAGQHTSSRNHNYTHQSQYHCRSYPNPKLPPNYRRDLPPGTGRSRRDHLLRPNFVIQLLQPTVATAYNTYHRAPTSGRLEIETLISQLNLYPETTSVSNQGPIAATLTFRQWVDALAAVVALWDFRLRETHMFVPKLISNVLVPSDTVELKDKLRALFSAHVRCLIDDGEIVKKLNQKIDEKSGEIAAVSVSMKRKGLSFRAFNSFNDTRNVLEAEKQLMVKRVCEFKSAMGCVLRYLEGINDVEDEDEISVFKFVGHFDWPRIHRVILRECRRLDDGLPIYGYRRDILRRIHGEQIMILIGETGSGKSTQLVQFLADSGVSANESIICTQPRKIAAISLVHRVREESSGCYGDNSVACYPTFSSAKKLDSKVVYMTDHCLLQHYMNDRNLSGVSCIVVDEAHERSLNTDLLLALLKDLLCRRVDLRLIIMSATADAFQLSDYFFGCGIFYVSGRSFPVELVYVPSDTEGTSVSGGVASYVHEVVKMAVEVHKSQKEGTILAFLTSQAEVEWACERFQAFSAVALPLHGKLSFEEQFHAFQNYAGKRKVIFSTNIAETSLTIPGVKYVIDSGMVKESKFEPVTGMNVLMVCRISQSSAKQRAGRAGRTEPGRCYRLYSEYDFELMKPNQEPEIRRVHLGVAVLRILALGIKNIEGFDFVDAPSPKAIVMAVQNLVQLGATIEKNGILELTEEGRYLVKMGLEPRLGKLILGCFNHRMGKEGLVLASVMANSSSIFCRVGNDNDKLKADCHKIQFCSQNGDLFTLLSVYKEWESLPRESRNKWCWLNSINAKSMRRCEDTVKELEICLEKELSIVIPSYWAWNSNKSSEHDKFLKKVILSSLSENVAMYTSYDRHGYEVASTGQHVRLHPSCSLLVFGQKPSWVVFGELLSVTDQYLVCVTAFDFEALLTLDPAPLFNVSEMEHRRFHVKTITGFGSAALKGFCGKSNSGLHSILSHARSLCMDERIGIQVNVDQNEILLFASPQDMGKVYALVNDALDCEMKWLRNECVEKFLYHGRGTPPFALFGAGAQIKHLELDRRFLTVDVFHLCNTTVDDKELLMFLEEKVGGCICSSHKSTSKQEGDEKEKWGMVTFLTPDSAMKATELQNFEFNGSVVKLFPSRANFGGNNKMPSFPFVKAKIRWPRKQSIGKGCLSCNSGNIHDIAREISGHLIGGGLVRCQPDVKFRGSVLIRGFDKEVPEAKILDDLREVTKRNDLELFLFRGEAVSNQPASHALEEALFKEIFPFMSERSPDPSCVQVEVMDPRPEEYFMRAMITFDGRLHLEAAKALQDLEGKVLPGCRPWQTIKCEQLFHSSLSCSPSVYSVIKKQLGCLLSSFKKHKGAEWHLQQISNGSYRVKISANATKTIADMRRSLEELMKGRLIINPSLTPSVLQHLFSRDCINMMRAIQHETETYIFFDRHNFNVRVFGSRDRANIAEEKLIKSLLTYHETKQLEIRLKGPGLPPDLMKEVVKRFGPDLHGIKEKVPGVDLRLDIRYHMISVLGDREMKQKVEGIVCEIAYSKDGSAENHDIDVSCPICLSEVEEGYKLEGCSHMFCKSCLLEQIESAIKNVDSFPIFCAHENCRAPILLADLRILLPQEKLDELFRASLSSFVTSSSGKLRFCPSPDCPSVYRITEPGNLGEPFVCGACHAETCTKCHLEYHPYLSCEKYKEFKDDPDSSLKDWCHGKDVKVCPCCSHTIEKWEGCNHVQCWCGKHICWVCLEVFSGSDLCYDHLRAVHNGIQ